MIPKLNVGGKTYTIESIDYLQGSPTVAIIEQDERKVFYHDQSISMNPEALNLSDAIFFEGRYDPIIKVMDEMMNINQLELAACAAEVYYLSSKNEYVPDYLFEKLEEAKEMVRSLSCAKDVVMEIIEVEGGS